jgi:hypothetical protein
VLSIVLRVVSLDITKHTVFKELIDFVMEKAPRKKGTGKYIITGRAWIKVSILFSV